MEIKNVPVRGYRKTRIGIVTSDKMDKTVVVAVKTKVRHPLYGKTVNQVPSKSRRTMRKILAVSAIPFSIMETRPLSKDKRWRVVEIIEKAK